MYLCLDVGNSHIHAGLASQEKKIIAQFRYATREQMCADEFGVFLQTWLNQQGYALHDLKAYIVSQVVPALKPVLETVGHDYLGLTPFFVEKAEPMPMTFKPVRQDVGADLICGAFAAWQAHPEAAHVVVDLGTATTVVCIDATGCFRGGAIFPGFGLSMRSLAGNTALLSHISPHYPPERSCGRTTPEAMLSGLYYSQMAAIEALCHRMIAEEFASEAHVRIVVTGGWSCLCQDHPLFDEINPLLVLEGALALYLTQEALAQ